MFVAKKVEMFVLVTGVLRVQYQGPLVVELKNGLVGRFMKGHFRSTRRGDHKKPTEWAWYRVGVIDAA